MQKHAKNSKNLYETYFQPIPLSDEVSVFCDVGPTLLPAVDEFTHMHYHKCYEVGICLAGDGLVICNGEFFSVSPGDAIFVSPGVSHYSRSLDKDSPCLCRFAYIKSSSVEKLYTPPASCALAAVIKQSEHPETVADVKRLVDVCTSDKTEKYRAAAMRTALLLIDGESAARERDGFFLSAKNKDEYSASVAEYISLHYNEPITAKELAERYHLSESQLRRRFSLSYGCPPMAYRNALRAKIARELLLNTAISVKSIAEKLGFTDASDFARSFAKVYGISPTEMRKRERAER